MNINVLNIGCFNIEKVNIRIYDCNNKLIVNDFINKKMFFNLLYGKYIIRVYGNSNLLVSCLVLHKSKNESFNIYLNSYQNSIKTFYLYDYFYNDLKIKRGEIILGT